MDLASLMSPSPSSEDYLSAGTESRTESDTTSQHNSSDHKRGRERVPSDTEEADEAGHEHLKKKRKEQRMQRNRQSAARSRKRKDDMLESLNQENKSLREELELLKSQLAAAISQPGFAAVSTHLISLC